MSELILFFFFWFTAIAVVARMVMFVFTCLILRISRWNSNIKWNSNNVNRVSFGAEKMLGFVNKTSCSTSKSEVKSFHLIFGITSTTRFKIQYCVHCLWNLLFCGIRTPKTTSKELPDPTRTYPIRYLARRIRK